MPKTAIAAFRKTADECQQRANLSSDRAIQAELFDLTAQWHWLAKQAAELCERTEEVELLKGSSVGGLLSSVQPWRPAPHP